MSLSRGGPLVHLTGPQIGLGDSCHAGNPISIQNMVVVTHRHIDRPALWPLACPKVVENTTAIGCHVTCGQFDQNPFFTTEQFTCFSLTWQHQSRSTVVGTRIRPFSKCMSPQISGGNSAHTMPHGWAMLNRSKHVKLGMVMSRNSPN